MKCGVPLMGWKELFHGHPGKVTECREKKIKLLKM